MRVDGLDEPLEPLRMRGLLTELLTDNPIQTLIHKHKPTPTNFKLPVQRHFPTPTDTARYGQIGAHNPKGGGSATRGGLPRRANRTRMSPLCPTVVVGLPGTAGSVKTRA